MHNYPQDRLDSLLDQLPVEETVRPEHREELRQQVLAEFDRTLATPLPQAVPLKRHTIWRFLMTHPAPRWTVLCLALAIAVGWSLWPNANGQAFALDQMLDTIMEAKTAKFQMSVTLEGQPQQSMTAYYSEPNHFRQEFGMGLVNVADWSVGKMVTINPMDKSASVINLKNMPEDQQRSGNWFEGMRTQLREAMRQPNPQFESLGTEMIAGRKAEGFRMPSVLYDLEVWGDVESGLPLRIVSVVPGPPAAKVMMSDFVFNVTLDEGLFSTEPPEGYKITSLDMESSLPTEQDLIAALKLCAEAADGQFPEALNTQMIAKLVGSMIAKEKPTSDTDTKAMMEKAVVISRGAQFAVIMPTVQGSEAWYAGKGVQLNAAQTPIFWWRAKDSSIFRVIYGDLSVTESPTAPAVENALQMHKSLEQKNHSPSDNR